MGGDSSFREGLTRRDALRVGAGAAGGLALAGGLLSRGLDAMAAPAQPGVGPYGPLEAPAANGVRLPKGFTSRVIAQTDVPPVPGGKPFHLFPDGMGTFKTKDGGFILVCNSEAPYAPGTWETGTAAIRFDPNFKVTDYYDILKDTSLNCSGGVTPWGTWLSCEEVANDDGVPGTGGAVWECDPLGVKPQVRHPRMGLFKHEATSIDPVGKVAYLTEDLGDGCLYKFTPTSYPDLSAGKLEAAKVAVDGKVSWLPVSDPENLNGVAPRRQSPDATRFKRGEGMWYDNGIIYFATTQDDRVYALHCAEQELEVLYDGVALGDDAPLHDTDNVTVSPVSGDLYVCEDAGDLQVGVISTEGEVAPFLQLPGPNHMRSELTGPAFDPTGKRFYFASQRVAGVGTTGAVAGGVVYEISGPFRRTRPEEVVPTPKDTEKPSVKIRVLGQPTLHGLLAKGQTFKLEIHDESLPVELEIKLVTKLRRAVGKGKRQVTIGRLTTKATKPGAKRIKVKVGKAFKDRLRKRDVAQAELIVVATDAEGNRTKVSKPVRFS